MTEARASVRSAAAAGRRDDTAAIQDGFTEITLTDGAAGDEDAEEEEFAEAQQYPSSSPLPPLPTRPGDSRGNGKAREATELPHEAGPALPVRRAAAAQPPPSQQQQQQQQQHRRSTQHPLRPTSLASVGSSGAAAAAGPSGPSSPSASSASASVRSSFYARSSYLNRPLPQTPPSAGPFFSSFSLLSSPPPPANAAAAQAGPRRLRLQPSTAWGAGSSAQQQQQQQQRRRTYGYGYGYGGGGSVDHGRLRGDNGQFEDDDNEDGSSFYDDDPHQRQAWLRARQSAARMARRRRWSEGADFPLARYKKLQADLEAGEGAFEVQGMFLARLAGAENAALDPDRFPRSRAEQQRQSEALATMRQETVEALQPLLAYGRGGSGGGGGAAQPTAVAAAGTGATKKQVPLPPPAPSSAGLGPAPAPAHLAGRHAAVGLPPTPPQSPHRGAGGDSRRSIDGQDAGAEQPESWRQSVKRASAMFGWGSQAAAAPSAPGSTSK